MDRLNHIIILVWVLFILNGCNGRIEPTQQVNEQPVCFPDYVGVTIPVEIAPLNFKIVADYSQMQVVFEPEVGAPFHVRGKKLVDIPKKAWKNMLEVNKGKTIQVKTSVCQNGIWIGYAPFSIYISNVPIDYGLAYRLIAPGYEVYSKMGIYQRNLSTFDQTAIYENTLVAGSCVNCHSFKLTDPKNMNMHIRGAKSGTMLMVDGKMNWLGTKTDKTMSNFVYPFWHPSGKYVAYSVNDTHQVFHSNNEKRVEVFDLKSDIIVYDVQNNQAILCPRLMRENSFETFPNFSPDGRTLYFCSAEAKNMPVEFKDAQYDLCKIDFDPEAGTFGETIDTLFKASAIRKSVTFPRPSPDGRYIMFTLSNYGTFSIWHKEADLYLMDLQTGKTRAIDEVNSNDTDSYHSWSSNSRWFVFSSRRIDGLYTRPFIAYLDENGKASKPFLLPQKEIDHYDNLLFSFNIPEFISGPVKLNIHDLENKINSTPTQVSFREIR